MAQNGFKVNKSLNLNPQASAPVNPVDGDVYFDSTAASLVYYNRGAWACLESIAPVASAINMTSSLLTPTVVKNAIVRLTGTGGNLYGMAASFAGKKVTLYNNCSGSITIRYNSSTEVTANNRVLTPCSGDMTLVAGEIAQFMYDTTQSRWLLVSVGSGAGAYAPATTTTSGIVTLNAAPVNSASPMIAVVNGAGRVVGCGINNDAANAGAADIHVGGGTKDANTVLHGDIRLPATLTSGILMPAASFQSQNAVLDMSTGAGHWNNISTGSLVYGAVHVPEGSTPHTLLVNFRNNNAIEQPVVVKLIYAWDNESSYGLDSFILCNYSLNVPDTSTSFSQFPVYLNQVPNSTQKIPESSKAVRPGTGLYLLISMTSTAQYSVEFNGARLTYTWEQILPTA